MFSANGVFSKDELDNASKLLIECFEDVQGDILDLGCGVGVVGISLLKNNPGLQVTFSDVNQRALKLTKKNLKYHDLKGDVRQSDAFAKISGEFDFILTNPPMAAGRDKCYEIIEDSKKHLRSKGCLGLVARHKKGGKMLKKKMREIFGNVEDVDKSGGFRVYKSVKE